MLTFSLAVFLLYHVSTATAALTLYQGRLHPASTTSYAEVEGVAVLGIGSGYSNFFDCVSSSANVETLSWGRVEGDQRFPVTTTSVTLDGVNLAVRRLFINASVGYSDIGIYSCSSGDEVMYINITGGITALAPVLSRVVGISGKSVLLRVYAAGLPPLTSGEIMWSKFGVTLFSDSRISITDTNKRLLIRNVNLEDSGTYSIVIRRQITALGFSILASTTIDLDVTVPLIATVDPSYVSVVEGGSAAFRCSVSGPSPAVVLWTKSGTSSLPIGVAQTGRDLVITQASRNHTGQYVCTAVGSSQMDTSTAILSVYSEPITASEPPTTDSTGGYTTMGTTEDAETTYSAETIAETTTHSSETTAETDSATFEAVTFQSAITESIVLIARTGAVGAALITFVILDIIIIIAFLRYRRRRAKAYREKERRKKVQEGGETGVGEPYREKSFRGSKEGQSKVAEVLKEVEGVKKEALKIKREAKKEAERLQLKVKKEGERLLKANKDAEKLLKAKSEAESLLKENEELLKVKKKGSRIDSRVEKSEEERVKSDRKIERSGESPPSWNSEASWDGIGSRSTSMSTSGEDDSEKQFMRKVASRLVVKKGDKKTQVQCNTS